MNFMILFKSMCPTRRPETGFITYTVRDGILNGEGITSSDTPKTRDKKLSALTPSVLVRAWRSWAVAHGIACLYSEWHKFSLRHNNCVDVYTLYKIIYFFPSTCCIYVRKNGIKHGLWPNTAYSMYGWILEKWIFDYNMLSDFMNKCKTFVYAPLTP